MGIYVKTLEQNAALKRIVGIVTRQRDTWIYTAVVLTCAVFLLVAALFFCHTAKADSAYMKLSAGPTKYATSGVWADNSNGYQSIVDSGPMLSVGFGVDRGWYNLEYGFIYLGKFELDALWGNPDAACSTCFQTGVGIQGGDVRGLTLAFIPKWHFAGGDLHANLGVIYYRATWKGDIFGPGNPYGQTFSIGPRLATNSITAFAGVGATWGDGKNIRFSIDLNHYPVSVDGSKYASTWGGGGGYKSITTLEFSVKVPL